jgi:hypothetical protein
MPIASSSPVHVRYGAIEAGATLSRDSIHPS